MSQERETNFHKLSDSFDAISLKLHHARGVLCTFISTGEGYDSEGKGVTTFSVDHNEALSALYALLTMLNDIDGLLHADDGKMSEVVRALYKEAYPGVRVA